MERTLEPFFATKARGTGLRLALCKKILEEHGGSSETEGKSGLNLEQGYDLNMLATVKGKVVAVNADRGERGGRGMQRRYGGGAWGRAGR